MGSGKKPGKQRKGGWACFLEKGTKRGGKRDKKKDTERWVCPWVKQFEKSHSTKGQEKKDATWEKPEKNYATNNKRSDIKNGRE